MEAHSFGPGELESLAGKYLNFALGENRCGVQILSVQEIIGRAIVTKVPKSPDYLKGVINLRGKIIPVVDLRTRLGLPEKEYDDRTCFIVVRVNLADRDVSIAVVVDTVLEVVNFKAEQIQPTPDYGSSVDTRIILGMGKLQNDVVILFDIEKVLLGAEDEILSHVLNA